MFCSFADLEMARIHKYTCVNFVILACVVSTITATPQNETMQRPRDNVVTEQELQQGEIISHTTDATRPRDNGLTGQELQQGGIILHSTDVHPPTIILVEDDTISHINTFQNTTASTQNWEPKEDSTQSTETKDHPLKRVYTNLALINYMVLTPILCPFGIIGNSFVAYVLFKKKNSNSSFIYMTFILLADIVSLISDIFVPIGNGLKMTNSAVMSQIGTDIIYWSKSVISVCFRRFVFNILCVLSYERLIAISRPLHLNKSFTVTHSSVFLLISFLYSIFYSGLAPIFTEFSKKEVAIFDNVTNTTSYIQLKTDWSYESKKICDLFAITTRLLSGPVQTIFLIIINVMIIYFLHKNKKSRAISGNVDRTKSISKLQVKLCKIFFVLIISNIAAFLPTQISLIVSILSQGLGQPLGRYILVIILSGCYIFKVLNSFTDFLVFMIMSEDIRKEVKALLCVNKSEHELSDFIKLSHIT